MHLSYVCLVVLLIGGCSTAAPSNYPDYEISTYGATIKPAGIIVDPLPAGAVLDPNRPTYMIRPWYPNQNGFGNGGNVNYLANA